MSTGKFQSGRNGRRRAKKKNNILLPILLGVAALAILIVGIVVLTQNKSSSIVPDNVKICGVDLSGMTEGEAAKALEAAVTDDMFAKDMVINMGEDEEPVTLSADRAMVTVDTMEAAKAACNATFDENGNCVLDTSFVKIDEDYLNEIADQAVTNYSRELQQTTIEEGKETREVEVELEDGKTEKQEQEVNTLIITPGIDERKFSADDFKKCVRNAYASLNFAPEMTYAGTEKAEPVDVDALVEKYCIEPINAEFDPDTFEIKPDTPGFGFDPEELKTQLAELKPGESVTVILEPIEAEATAETLKNSLFADELGECDTAHTYNNDRTTNLKLACEAIDGTILMPGQVFSFNDIVGERTKAKGYKEAIAYVSGKSVPETGGGVCQVASTIYSACLYADLEIIESYAHQFFVTYVNPGMDATIYWKSLDYKFRNNTPYPIRIDASCHDGRVWVSIKGTNTKDYTVKITWELISTTAWETVEHVIKPGEDYKPGEVINTPYTGYKYVTYMNKYDLDGNLISTTKIRTSNYSKRDKEVAVAPEEETSETQEPSSEPTEPTEKPTEKPTEPPTEPTEPPVDPTDPPEPPEDPGEG